MVNVRRPSGQPKYWAIKGSRRGGIYPSRDAILAGRPLIIVEGELDALLLGQELAGLAPVVTLGTAGDRPKPAALNAMLGARAWLISGDTDAAGEESAGHWVGRFGRCRRVRPPAGKDWTEAYQAGTNLRAWWSDILGAGGVLTSPEPRKAEQVRPMLGPVEPGWQPPAWWIVAFFDLLQGWLESYDERAAIVAFDGGLGRAEAERRACS